MFRRMRISGVVDFESRLGLTLLAPRRGFGRLALIRQTPQCLSSACTPGLGFSLYVYTASLSGDCQQYSIRGPLVEKITNKVIQTGD